MPDARDTLSDYRLVPTTLAGYRATVHCSFGKISTKSYASDDSVH